MSQSRLVCAISTTNKLFSRPLSYMILSIIMRRRPRRMTAAHRPGEIMWIIELNVAGYHFTREFPDVKRPAFRFSPRNIHWPVPRHSNAA